MTLKEKLLKRQLTIGSWLSFDYTPIVEIMANVGFEWLVIDMEHTSITEKEALQMIQIISLSKVAPIVRVGKNDELLIKRCMDAGAHGVVVPMVLNKEDAEKAVSYVKYPLLGKRGVGLFRAQNYGLGFSEYKDWVEKNSIVIVQIEHIEAVNNLDEIMSVEGVDGFIIGPYDLSASIGFPGEFSRKEVKHALNLVKSFMNKSEKPGGYHIVHSDPKQLQAKISEGYSFIAYGVDMIFFAETIEKELSNIKGLINGTK